jgi:Patatin-like phospholipase
VRTRLTGILLAGIAIASFAIVASAVASYAQSPDRPEARQSAQARRAVHAPATGAASTPKQRRADKKNAKTATKPPPGLPADKQSRREFTAADEAVARVPGLPPDVRFWGDSVADFQRALPAEPGAWLILSTGGEEGAYGAGFLNGWAATGTRPRFSVVTGVSTGALMATYVFAGGKYDEELHQVYTTISATDVFEVASTPESLTDTWPLGKTIEKHVTPELLAAVAAEHQKGRRLLVLTTNLDAGRPIVWNMGAIAAQSGDTALKLFRQVLLAAASVEGMFPPVYITVEANGRQFQEMHGDGGASGPLFFGPEAYLMPGTPLRLPATGLYAIFNGKLSTEFYLPSRTTAGILGRSIGIALKAGGRLQLALAGIAAQKANIPLNFTYVDEGFEQVGRGLFDPKYMNALYDYGLAQGGSDGRFRKGPPTPGPASPTASSGPAGEAMPK